MKMTKAINIIFDGPPGRDAPAFVEVETDDGESIRIGEWVQKGNHWALRITKLPLTEEDQIITQDDIDHVLRLAEDELEHLRRDGELDDECKEDYLCSKKVFGQVREYLTPVPEIPPSSPPAPDMKYNFKTEVVGGKIHQALSVTRHAVTTEIMGWVYDTKEKAVRQALISLGWIPPVEHLVTEEEIKP